MRYCQSTKARSLFPFSAQCLVLCGTCYASVTWCFWPDSAENWIFLQLPFIAGRRFPVVVQRPIPMVLPLEDHRNSAVAVFAWWSMFLLCRSCSMPVVVDKCPWFRSCRIRGGSAVAVPPVVDVAVSCSDKLSRDSESATDSVHRRSQWTFQSPQRQVSTVAAVHGRLLAAMKGSSLQFCSIFRPPSIWTSRPRVAGTQGV